MTILGWTVSSLVYTHRRVDFKGRITLNSLPPTQVPFLLTVNSTNSNHSIKFLCHFSPLKKREFPKIKVNSPKHKKPHTLTAIIQGQHWLERKSQQYFVPFECLTDVAQKGYALLEHYGNTWGLCLICTNYKPEHFKNTVCCLPLVPSHGSGNKKVNKSW